jgi:predicted nucleotidyltransferase
MTLADALFTKTQQRLFALLFGQPERSFFATELIQLTRSGSGAVQRELARLEHSGLVSVTRIGNQKHFQANRAAPLFAELRNIVVKTVGILGPLRDALEPFLDCIELALVFGSVAKKADTARSDVDLLVVSDALTLEQIYAAMDTAERKLARKISPTLYTREEFERRRSSQSSFLNRVLAGDHMVIVGDGRDLAATR